MSMAPTSLNRILDGLNPQQREAVESPDGPVLVLAGAGSGKTRVLTYRFAYLVANGVPPQRILAITFTNKAAGEMKSRVEELLGSLNPDLWVSTFHAACVRILRRDYDKIGGSRSFTIFDGSDQLAAVRECIRELCLSEKRYGPGSVLAAISRAKNDLMNPDEFARSAQGFFEERVAEVYRLYQRKLLANRALDFDDLLLETIRLFRERPDVLDHYKRFFLHILVDEYQDTNRAQYLIVRMLAGERRNVFVVGDDDQGIYKFRGADVRNILEFEKDYPDAKVIKLEQNYRSTQHILDAAWHVIRNNLSRKEKRLWTKNGRGQRVIYCRTGDQHGEAYYVAGEVERLRTAFGLPYSSFAVLYRTHAQSRPFEEVLMGLRIPYTIVGGLKFYERKEIKDVIAYLRLMVNPSDAVSLKRVINVPKRGLGDRAVERILGHAERTGIPALQVMKEATTVPDLAPAAAKRAVAFAELIEGLREESLRGGLFETIEKVLDETGYLKELEEDASIESLSRIENLRELLNVAREFDLERAGDQADAPQGALASFLESVALMTDIDSHRGDQDAVVLMTLHTAKGLEFPVVFMVGMEEGLFPHARSVGDEEEIEEERRLCYVGMTRARELLYLTSARERMMYGEVVPAVESRFITEIPDNLVSRVECRGGRGW